MKVHQNHGNISPNPQTQTNPGNGMDISFEIHPLVKFQRRIQTRSMSNELQNILHPHTKIFEPRTQQTQLPNNNTMNNNNNNNNDTTNNMINKQRDEEKVNDNKQTDDWCEPELTNTGSLALLLHEKWLDRILIDGKTWEIRGRDTKIRGKIYLAYKDRIYGETNLINSLPITKQELKNSVKHHHVEDLSIIQYRTPYVWVLENSIKYSQPIKFKRKPGQVIWCKVNMYNLNDKGDEIIDVEDKYHQQRTAMIIDSDPSPDIFKKLTDDEWNKLINSTEYSCCNKKVGGCNVLCDECDSEWHIYCLRYHYHINEDELQRIQKDGEPFICMDCYRVKLGKIRKLKTRRKR